MITVKDLTKKYGNFLAIDHLSFEIEDGHIYGFLGPNGAGKSTTLNIMTGTLAATDGQVQIDGLDIFEEAKAAKKRIGYLPEIPPLYVDQTPREYLKFVAEAKGIKKQELQNEIEKVIGETHIDDVADKLIKYLSKGYRQRVGIAQALLGNPSVIILDEPTVGLDPMQIIEIRDLIIELGKSHTVILSSHILTEVQALCDRILIIYKGKLVAFDTPENLQKAFESDLSLSLKVEGEADDVEACLKDIVKDGIMEVKAEDGFCYVDISIDTDADSVCKDIFYACVKANLPLLQMIPTKATLEDIFIELTQSDEVYETETVETADKEEV